MAGCPIVCNHTYSLREVMLARTQRKKRTDCKIGTENAFLAFYLVGNHSNAVLTMVPSRVEKPITALVFVTTCLGLGLAFPFDTVVGLLHVWKAKDWSLLSVRVI